jgi:ELWxxDGT repeat protein
MLQVNNLLFFSANNGEHGQELWVTDGTQDGTFMLFDLVEGSESSSPTHFVASPTHLYFSIQPKTGFPEIYSFTFNP